MVDAVRQMLKEIESTGQDGEDTYPELLQAAPLDCRNPVRMGLLPRSPPPPLDPPPQNRPRFEDKRRS